MKRLIICVTGPMAAGKNAASALFEKKGFKSADADLLGHIACENAKSKILDTFGKLAEEKGISLLTQEGKLNRRNLGKLIFGNKKLVKMQEDIVFPEISRLLEQFDTENSTNNIIINATVLYKVPYINRCDAVFYVDCPSIIRLFRARKRDKMPFSLIYKRFLSQKNLFAKYKKSAADIRRVWNTGTIKSLEKKIDVFLKKYREGF